MILDGRQIATEILEQIKLEVQKLPFKPVFCDVLVGDDSASTQYVKMKAKAAEKVGIKFHSANFPSTITTEELIQEIYKLNKIQNICGLIVQLPLPEHINKQSALNAIDPKIDADSTGEVNTNLFYNNQTYVGFPTALAVMELLNRAKADYKNHNFLVLGQGQLVGKPVSFLLSQLGAKVNIARSKTENTAELMRQADVIISAVGKPKLVSGDKVKTNVIIIDAGTSESDGSVVGDVDFETVKEKAAYISPVPGGVGPLTVAMLLKNVLTIAKSKI